MAIRPPCELPTSQAGSSVAWASTLSRSSAWLKAVSMPGVSPNRPALVVGDHRGALGVELGSDLGPGPAVGHAGVEQHDHRSVAGQVLGGQLRSVRGGEPTSWGHARRP